MDNVQPLPFNRSLVASRTVAAARRKAFQELTKTMPVNDMGLPRYLYRTDLIPQDIFHREAPEREQLLTSAIVPLEYAEGFPALEDGQPLWSQLPFEPDHAYKVFLRYVEMGQQEGVRLVEHVAQEINADLALLMDYFHLYYWKFRCKAYDLYVTVVHEKRRAQRLMSTEDRHYIMAEKLLQKCVDYFDAVNWESVDPATVARLIPALVEIERKSLGMTGVGGDNEIRPQSVEIMLRQITKTDIRDESQGTQKNLTLDILTQNPEAARAAQELIIRLGG